MIKVSRSIHFYIPVNKKLNKNLDNLEKLIEIKCINLKKIQRLFCIEQKLKLNTFNSRLIRKFE